MEPKQPPKKKWKLTNMLEKIYKNLLRLILLRNWATLAKIHIHLFPPLMKYGPNIRSSSSVTPLLVKNLMNSTRLSLGWPMLKTINTKLFILEMIDKSLKLLLFAQSVLINLRIISKELIWLIVSKTFLINFCFMKERVKMFHSQKSGKVCTV